MSSPSEATTSTKNRPPTEEEEEEEAAKTPTPALQTSKSSPASFPPRVTPNNQQASSNNFNFHSSGDVTPNNQQASSSNVTVPPPGENTLNERIGLITNSVGVVLTKYEDEKEELKAEKKQLSDRVDARDDKIENLEATIESKTKEVTKKNAALAQKEKHNKRDKDIHKQIQDKMNEEISDHKQDLAAAQAEIQKTKHELDDAGKKNTELEQEATAYKMDTETQLRTKQEGIEQLKGELDEMGEENDELNREVDSLTSLLAEANAETQKNIDDLVVAEKKNTELEQERTAYTANTNTKLTSMRANIGQLEGTIVSLKEESVMKETAYEGLMVRYEERERDVKQAEADNMKAIQERDVFEQTCIKLGREAVVCSTNLRFAQQDVSDKNIDIQKLQTDNRNLQNDNANIRGEITVAMNAHADKKKLTTENAELRDKLKSEKENYNKDIASHKKELAKKDAELATGNEELASKNEELARLQAKVEQLGLEKEELKEVKQEVIEQQLSNMNEHERKVDANEINNYEENLAREREEVAQKEDELVEEQQKVARKKDELDGELARKEDKLVRDQEEIAQKEVKLARRKRRPTNLVDMTGNNDEEDSKLVMDPTKVPPDPRYQKKGCGEKWWYKCPADCRSKLLGDERAFKKHVMGNKWTNGCRPYAKQNPRCIASYTRVWDDTPKKGGKYRPTFAFADHKTNDGLTPNELDTREKKWQKELQKHEEQDCYEE